MNVNYSAVGDSYQDFVSQGGGVLCVGGKGYGERASLGAKAFL